MGEEEWKGKGKRKRKKKRTNQLWENGRERKEHNTPRPPKLAGQYTCCCKPNN